MCHFQRRQMWAGSVSLFPYTLLLKEDGNFYSLFLFILLLKEPGNFPVPFHFFFFLLKGDGNFQAPNLALFRATGTWKFPCAFTLCYIKERGSFPACTLVFYRKNMEISVFFIRCVSQVICFTFFSYRMVRDTQRHISENICSGDDLRSRILGTFVVRFRACLPLLGFSNI